MLYYYNSSVILSRLIVRGAVGTEYWKKQDSLLKKIKLKMGSFYSNLSFTSTVSATYGKSKEMFYKIKRLM